MLAQNFKGADELGLTEKGLQALIRVLRMLETNELVYSPDGMPIHNGFNMKLTWWENECGTVGCIGGWAGFYTERLILATTTGSLTHGLGQLFCPPSWRTGKCTVEQAAYALRAYLVTGEPDWGLD